jgi:hypothetical protein
LVVLLEVFCRSGCSLCLYFPLLILRYNPYFFIFILYCSLSGELIGNIRLSDIRNYECVIQFCRSSSFRIVRRGVAAFSTRLRFLGTRKTDTFRWTIVWVMIYRTKAGSEQDWINLTGQVFVMAHVLFQNSKKKFVKWRCFGYGKFLGQSQTFHSIKQVCTLTHRVQNKKKECNKLSKEAANSEIQQRGLTNNDALISMVSF